MVEYRLRLRACDWARPAQDEQADQQQNDYRDDGVVVLPPATTRLNVVVNCNRDPAPRHNGSNVSHSWVTSKDFVPLTLANPAQRR